MKMLVTEIRLKYSVLTNEINEYEIHFKNQINIK